MPERERRARERKMGKDWSEGIVLADLIHKRKETTTVKTGAYYVGKNEQNNPMFITFVSRSQNQETGEPLAEINFSYDQQGVRHTSGVMHVTRGCVTKDTLLQPQRNILLALLNEQRKPTEPPRRRTVVPLDAFRDSKHAAQNEMHQTTLSAFITKTAASMATQETTQETTWKSTKKKKTRYTIRSVTRTDGTVAETTFTRTSRKWYGPVRVQIADQWVFPADGTPGNFSHNRRYNKTDLVGMTRQEREKIIASITLDTKRVQDKKKDVVVQSGFALLKNLAA